ncbi:MAG: hypothetical protein IJX77_04055 [Ruminococcus sp.]|nr:hypothetical protein [Ruminococcus sp.]MBQ8296936.1 hypothetical protein [Ruminococcus sp.]
MNKKLLTITTAIAFASTLTFTSYAEAEEDVLKNWDYFTSLSDDAVLSEYKAYCEAVGKEFRETSVSDGIIKYDFIARTNMEINYGSIEYGCTFSFVNPNPTDLTESDMYSMSPEYYGFTEETHGNYMFYSFSSGFTDGEVYCYAPYAENFDAYDLLRTVLTIYNSDFYQDFGNDDVISFAYIDGGSDLKLGDANLDADVTITDAVKIMMHVTNPSQYPLYVYGAEVADVYQQGDGLSNLDSLAVQKYLAGIISALPESLFTDEA